MKQIFQVMKKKWKWGVGLTVVLALVLFAFAPWKPESSIHAADEKYNVTTTFGGSIIVGENGTSGTYTMRRSEDVFSFNPYGNLHSADLKNIKWSCEVDAKDTAVGVVELKGTGSTYNPSDPTAPQEVKDLQELRFKALGEGTAYITFTAETDTDLGDITITITVNVGLAIDRGLNASAAAGHTGVTGAAWVNFIHEGDTEAAIIMEPGTELPIATSAPDTTKMNLIYGDASKQTWVSGDSGIVEVKSADKKIIAAGVGHTKLSVGNGADSIDVFVRPKLTYMGQNRNNATPTEIGDTNSISMRDGDYIRVDNFVRQGSAPIASKIDWLITQYDGVANTYIFFKDSKGSTVSGANPKGEISLVPELYGNTQYYKLNAKAGTYRVQFFTADTYAGWEKENINESASTTHSNCKPVDVTMTVSSNFKKDIYDVVNVGGVYDISAALNISLENLLSDFEFSQPVIDDEDSPSNNTPTDLITISQWLATASTMYPEGGDVKFNVTRVSYSAGELMGLGSFTSGIEVNDVATIHLKILQTFQMNITQTTVGVGKAINLAGVWGTEPENPSSVVYEWSVSDASKVSVSPEGTGKTAKVQTLIKTDKNTPVTVTLTATTEDGTIYTATCKITIQDTVEEIVLSESSIEIEVGDPPYRVTIPALLQTGQNYSDLIWRSSDEKIFTVDSVEDSGAAANISGVAAGEAVLMVANPANGAIATCEVIVSRKMDAIQITRAGQVMSDSATYPISLKDGTLKLSCQWTPNDVTKKYQEVEWISLDTTKATIVQDGKDVTVTLLAVGSVIIRVQCKADPEKFAQVTLNITETQITDITLNGPSAISLLIGETYQLSATINPPEPDNATLRWESNNTAVATVDNTGLVTAVGVSDPKNPCIITVSAPGNGAVTPRTVVVEVGQKLESIEFNNISDTVEVGKTLALNVEFTPSENVNKSISFTSTDPTIATVDNNGVVTGVKEGDTMIICVSAELGSPGAITCNIHVIPAIIPAESFSIDPTSKTIKEGESFQIVSNFVPDNASDKTVIYVADNPEIVTVTESGLVLGLKTGTTVITCTSAELGTSAFCLVTVEPAIKFSLSPSTRTIVKGRSFTLKKVVSPANTNTASTWKSSNTKIATVSSSGKVTAKKLGSCTITCTLTQSKLKATCQVKVVNLKTTLKLNKSSIRINIGQTYRLIKTVKTNDETVPKVKFTSKNKRIASVGRTSGKVKGKKVGSTVITAKTTDAYHATAKCRVVVIRRATSVTMKKAYAVCYVGGSIKLSATVKPKSATIKGLKWTSADTNIASVTQSGKVTGRSVGDVYITAATKDGSNKSDNCLVRVLEPIAASSVMVAQSKLTMKKGDTAQLSYTILPSNTTDTVKMASDNKRVATVTNTGKIKAKNTGAATITITTSSGITNTVEVHVVAMNKTSIKIRQYDTENLFVTGTDDTITWYSGNNRIASVANGKVTGRGTGTTYIYAFVDGCKMACKVKVVSVNTKSR